MDGVEITMVEGTHSMQYQFITWGMRTSIQIIVLNSFQYRIYISCKHVAHTVYIIQYHTLIATILGEFHKIVNTDIECSVLVTIETGISNLLRVFLGEIKNPHTSTPLYTL